MDSWKTMEKKLITRLPSNWQIKLPKSFHFMGSLITKTSMMLHVEFMTCKSRTKCLESDKNLIDVK